MRLSDNKKFIAARIRDLSKLILKDRGVTSRLQRRFKNILRITKMPARHIQVTVVWVLMHAYPNNNYPRMQYIDIEGYIDAAKREDNWAYTSDLPTIQDIVAALDRNVGDLDDH